MTNLVTKILTLCMSMVMYFNTLGVVLPGEIMENIINAELEYSFENQTPGSAAGEIELTAKKDGEYKLFWGEDDDEKLSIIVGDYEAAYSEFSTLNVKDGFGKSKVQEFTAIPDGAEYILIYKGIFLVGSEEIPQEKKADYGNHLYNFGALSDVHFDRYSYTLGDDASMLFPNALNFLENFDIELVAMPGDLSNSGELTAFEKFKKITSNYSFPVYTCTGNHDTGEDFSLENWQKLINDGAYSEQKAVGIKSVCSNGMDFVYSPDEISGDVFIFFNQNGYADENEDVYRLVTDEQLDWLDEQLELYNDRTVYLFFHTFLTAPDGNGILTEGNCANPNGVNYDGYYTYGNPDEVRFRRLLEENKNVIVFNGHSHWRYDMQKYNDKLNITDYDGTFATMVHVSSVSSPRWMKDNDTDYYNSGLLSSEGYIVKVYENYIVLTGIDFLRGEMLAYANYVIER